MNKFLFFSVLFLCFFSANGQQRVLIPSTNGVNVVADLYFAKDTNATYILLCHQAGYSRGEYREIAPKLAALGYNCLAIDQRSGKEVNGVKNETAEQATQLGVGTEYLDAETDIQNALTYVFLRGNRKRVILWGSSYSASLVLKIATETKKPKAVIAFSPGEYFKNKFVLKTILKKLDMPCFVSSSKQESEELFGLVKDISAISQFIPKGDGVHGSSALNVSTKNNAEYWAAVEKFLQKVK